MPACQCRGLAREMNLYIGLRRLAFYLFVALAGCAFCHVTVVFFKRTDFIGAQTIRYASSGTEAAEVSVIVRGCQTGNSYALVQIYCEPHAAGYGRQSCSHPPLKWRTQNQTIDVQQGKLSLLVNETLVVLTPESEAFVIHEGTEFTFSNAAPETPLKMTIRAEPAMPDKSRNAVRADRFWEGLAGLSYDYGGLSSINPFQAGLLLHDAGSQNPEVSGGLPRTLAAYVEVWFARVARLCGFRSLYHQYTTASPACNDAIRPAQPSHVAAPPIEKATNEGESNEGHTEL
eukprot:TRINITY_DN5104_c0_g1_i3.p1 TRINITY_DN5104_c0_g1~~TRINITY_DN5104_c0_g1_i3.p1  ORF type:complete len:288 (-),score=15.61 TRINITY_DN5104_c0_g1_i3:139-1002(-)